MAYMYIPVIKKIINSNNVNVERSLPTGGKVNIAKGERAEPFSRVGMSKISYKQMELPVEFELTKGKSWKSFFYTGEKLGKLQHKNLVAPFDGYLEKTETGYILKEEDKVYWLLAGVWGEIVNVTEDKSVLIKTQATDIYFAASTPNSISGELIVFPNPSEILEMQYLEKFEKYAFGKIIYVGNYASPDVIKKALDLGVVGIIAGSADRTTFSLAKQNKMFMGVFSGFGNIPTPKAVFDILKEVSNRYVFISGDSNLLRIPMPIPFDDSMLKQNSPKSVIKLAKKGIKVVVLQDPVFGYVGEVDRVYGSSIFVRLEENNQVVEVSEPNVLAIE